MRFALPMLWPRGRPVGKMLRDRRGATAIEFAIVVVPFFGLVLLILQVGLWHFSIQSLDFAVRQAGRKIMTGQVSPSAVTAATFKTTYICPATFWAISCDKLIVNAFKVGSSSDAKTASGVYAFIDAGSKTFYSPASRRSFCLGSPGDFIYLDAAYPYPNFVGSLLQANADKTWMMRSSTVIYNEPVAKSSGASC